MQHTLLPLNDRRALRREYRIRMAIVFLFMLSVACLVGIGSLFPAFTHAMSGEKTISGEIDSIKNTENSGGFSRDQSELMKDGVLLAALNSGVSVTPLSTVVGDIVGLRGPLKLTSISISRVGTTSINVVILGKAPTRDDLLAFKGRLENQTPGTAVNLPITELAQSTDLQFSVEVTEPQP